MENDNLRTDADNGEPSKRRTGHRGTKMSLTRSDSRIMGQKKQTSRLSAPQARPHMPATTLSLPVLDSSGVDVPQEEPTYCYCNQGSHGNVGDHPCDKFANAQFVFIADDCM